MNRLQIIRENGNVPKSLPGEDHVSGLLFYLPNLPTGFTASDNIKAISTIDAAEALGITADNTDWHIKVLHYQLSETFRINPAISLYVCLSTSELFSYTELKNLQNFAAGRIRQIAIYRGGRALQAEDIAAMQGVADSFEDDGTPASIIFAPQVASISTLPTNLATTGNKNVSVIIGQDGGGVAAQLYSTAPTVNAAKTSVTAIGVALGILSKARVHESIAYVKRFPSGLSEPAFADGTLYNTVDKAVIEGLDTARYLFFRTYPGIGGSYFNDSHTLDIATSDYAFIEANRVMDKACRGIMAYLTPELSSPLYVDAETGKLSQGTIAYLETVAGTAIEDMEKAGEISGYKVEINPEQNVLATSEVEIIIKKVAVGVMRTVKVKVGFTTKLN